MKIFFRCWLVKLARDTLVGFLLLSFSLWLLGYTFPNFYNFLTQWANSPKLPDMSECRVTALLDSPTKNLSAYSVSIKVSDQKDGIYDIIFAAQDAFVSVYEAGASKRISDDDRNFISKRFVSKDGRREVEFKFDISINHNQQGSPSLQIGILSDDECPVDVFPLRRKK